MADRKAELERKKAKLAQIRAEKALFDRRLFTEEDPPEAEYYLCVEGRFANRIIIPFEQDGEVYFFQARALDPEQQPKYLNPSSEMAPKGSEVLYPYDEAADELVVCEG